MRARAWADLIVVNLLALLLIIAIVAFPSNVIRIILGIPFLLFLPGYTLVAALFPRKQGLDGIQRVALSLGMSIAIVPLIGLILNYTAWGITLESVLGTITGFMVIMSVVTLVRRQQLTEGERFGIRFHLSIPGLGEGIWDRTLTVMLVISVLGAMAAAGYAIATLKDGEEFTEFYLLGSDGETNIYPKIVYLREEGHVTVGIMNHEYRVVSYQIEVLVNGEITHNYGPINLDHTKKWEQEVSFSFKRTGIEQVVEFLLYRGESDISPQQLRLVIDIYE